VLGDVLELFGLRVVEVDIRVVGRRAVLLEGEEALVV
jgi:hypothetical protein